MKIAHIVYGLEIGGIETMLVNIANLQVEQGHDIYVVVINNLIDQELRSRLSGCVHFMPLGRKTGSKNPIPVMRLNWELRTINPDVIHLHDTSIFNYILLPSLRKKTCVTIHNVCVREKLDQLPNIKKIFAISNSIRQDIKDSCNLDSTTVYNGILFDKITPRQSFEHPDTFKILQTGRLDHNHKGQDILINAVKLLRDNGVKNVSLTLWGDGPSRQYLEELTKKYKLEKIVKIVGSVSQEYVFKHLHEYDLLVQPSRYEGFGNTIVEAMAAKVPVLVSNVEAPMEIIDNGQYGYSFQSENAVDCYNTIKDIITNGVDVDMINKAYKQAFETYNIKSTAKKYLNLYVTNQQ